MTQWMNWGKIDLKEAPFIAKRYTLQKEEIVLLFRKYVEIYNTLNLEKFFAAKEILASNSIQYKDTNVNNQLRLALNNIRGDNYLLSRDGTVKTNYRLSVEKNDEQKARLLLNNV